MKNKVSQTTSKKVVINGREYTPFENLSDIQEGQKVIVLENSRHRRGDVCTVGDIGTETTVCLELYGRTSYYNLAPYTEPKEETKANPEDCVELKPGIEVCVSRESNEVAIKSVADADYNYYYIGKAKDGCYVVEMSSKATGKILGVNVREYCLPIPKQEEKPKPKYKIGDKLYLKNEDTYTTILKIKYDKVLNKYLYNYSHSDIHFRLATPEEIELYFTK